MNLRRASSVARATTTRVVLVVLAAILLFTLTACGGSPKGGATSDNKSAYGPAEGKTLVIAEQNPTSVTQQGTTTEVQTAVGTVTQKRGAVAVLDQTASDPRAAGTVEATINANVRADDSEEFWGTLVIKNDEGTWGGEFSAAIPSETVETGVVQYMVIVARGTGAYEGLKLHLQGYGPASAGDGFAPGTHMAFTGWIAQEQ